MTRNKEGERTASLNTLGLQGLLSLQRELLHSLDGGTVMEGGRVDLYDVYCAIEHHRSITGTKSDRRVVSPAARRRHINPIDGSSAMRSSSMRARIRAGR
ncbi:hypothetical protein C4577_04390 [Candidatus Parcubacteria bacterium]|nr:MAG: hypothetical protein C4577_04390 [Candidatus Parcubacteria bacterium]